jgi:NTE family protein
VSKKVWMADLLPEDTDGGELPRDGRVMEMLSEHTLIGWLEGYLLSGRHGFFHTYEAFAHVIDSMFNQHAKWLDIAKNHVPWRASVASQNILLSSTVWRQDHNGFSHQDPGFIDRVPSLAARAAHLKEQMKNEIILHLAYAHEHGTDREEITNWVWPFQRGFTSDRRENGARLLALRIASRAPAEPEAFKKSDPSSSCLTLRAQRLALRERRSWPGVYCRMTIGETMKLVIATLCLFAAFSAATAEASRPRIGLVLAGGGAKGSAHIGVLKVLEELRVPIDAIAGTSMGALVGGGYASGLSAAEMEEAVTSVDWNQFFDDDPPRAVWPMRRKEESLRPTFGFSIGRRDGKFSLPKGAISGQEILLYLSELTRGAEGIERFDQLPIPFRAVATDLETGEMVVFEQGPLPLAMRASMAVPGVFAPLETEGRIYVDGGIVRNLPVDIARAMGVDRLIVVKLDSDPPTREQLSTVLGSFGQMINFVFAQNEARSLTEVDPRRDILVTPQLGDITPADFDRGPEAIATGVEAARRVSDQLARLAVSPAEYAAWRALVERRREPVEHIDEVRVVGLERVSPTLFEPVVERHQGKPLDRSRLESDLNRLYGRGDFERVNYRIERADGRNLLIVDAVEKAWGPGYLSFGLGLTNDFQGDSRFGLRATYRQTWINALGGEWLTSINLGNEPHLFSEFYQPVNAARTAFVAPYIDLGKQPLGVFQGDDRVARYDIARYRAGLDLGATFGRFAELRLGLLAGQVDASVDTGSPLVPEATNTETGLRGRLLYDTRDSGGLARSGSFVKVDLLAPIKSLGANEEYFRTELQASKAVSSGPNTLVANLRGGTAFGEEMPYYDQFPLGGFLKLSGYANEQFRGNEYAFGSLVLQHQLTTLTPPLGKGLYLGGSLEVGRQWDVIEALNPSETRYGSSLFFGADTWLGPFYLGLGLSADGDATGYVTLGKP